MSNRNEIITKLSELLKVAVDIPVPPVPTNISVAPMSQAPAPAPASGVSMPMELPPQGNKPTEEEYEPTEEEERAFQERQRRRELEEQTYIVDSIPDEVSAALAELPDARVGYDRADGRWHKQEGIFEWSFHVEESKVRDNPTYTAELIKLTGKPSRLKPNKIFETTGPDPVVVFKALRGHIFRLLSEQKYVSDEKKERRQEREEQSQEQKDLAEKNRERQYRQKEFDKYLAEEESDEREASSRIRNIITKVSNRLKTKGFVNESSELDKVLRNLKY